MITRKRTNFQRPQGIQVPEVTAECELIEEKVRKALNGTGTVELIRNPYFTPRDAGVPAETDIRTDKMEILRNAIGRAQEKYWEDRDNRNKKFEEEDVFKNTSTEEPGNENKDTSPTPTE